MYRRRLPEGTRVRVIRGIHQSDPSRQTVTTGVIETWKQEPAGAWYARGHNGKLWIERLRVRKADGEVSMITLDDHTWIQPIEALKE